MILFWLPLDQHVTRRVAQTIFAISMEESRFSTSIKRSCNRPGHGLVAAAGGSCAAGLPQTGSRLSEVAARGHGKK
jgi:hypothetical protein